MIESRILLLINQSGESLERLVTRRGFRVRIRQAAVSEYWRVDVADDPSAFLHPLRESPVLALADALGIRVKGAKAVPGVPGHEHRVAGDGIGLLHAPASCVNQPLVRLVIRMPLASEQMSTGTAGDLDHVGQPVFEHRHIVIEEAEPVAATKYFLRHLRSDLAEETEDGNGFVKSNHHRRLNRVPALGPKTPKIGKENPPKPPPPTTPITPHSLSIQ